MHWSRCAMAHGPDAPAAKKSVGMINKYHAHFARSFPDGLSIVAATAWVGLLVWSASSILGSVGVVKPLCGRVAGLGSRPPTVRTCFTSALWGV